MIVSCCICSQMWSAQNHNICTGVYKIGTICLWTEKCETAPNYCSVLIRLRSESYPSRTEVFFFWRRGGGNSPQWARTSLLTRYLHHTQRTTSVGRTPLDEWLARHIDLYLTTHNTFNRRTSMPPVGFEPNISAGERQQTYTLDRAATGTGWLESIGVRTIYIQKRLCRKY
jgi:hypothetical protein